MYVYRSSEKTMQNASSSHEEIITNHVRAMSTLRGSFKNVNANTTINTPNPHTSFSITTTQQKTPYIHTALIPSSLHDRYGK